MSLRFTKMHGLGNDYVYISTFDQVVAAPEKLAPLISDRHRGIGSDGLILVAPPDVPGADVRMIMFNADGSRAQMCGNGVRCVAKLAYERGLARRNPLRVQTDRGVLTLELTLESRGSGDGAGRVPGTDRVTAVRVDMGEPILDPARIPVRLPGPRVVNVRVFEVRDSHLVLDLPTDATRGETANAAEHGAPADLRLTAVSMGNPHAVFFVPELAAVPLAAWGPRIEQHELFPERVNVHFAEVVRPDYVWMVTWERGAGATQACGTGACAVCVAGVLSGLTQRSITAMLPGGELQLAWDEATDHVFMTGPAVEVFSGEWPDR